MTIEVSIEEVTPEQAKEYLSRNINNRPLNKGQVAGWARDMAEGRWLLTGQGIGFDIEGNLIDGQHRLSAQIVSNTTQTWVVTRGQAKTAIGVLDSGKKRTVGDFLGMQGIQNRAVCASIARLAMLYEKGVLTTNKDVTTNAEIEQYFSEHDKEIMRAGELTVHYRGRIPALSSSMGTAILFFNRVDPEKTLEFFDAMAQMNTRGAGDPRSALIHRIHNIANQKTRISQVESLDMFIRAWNAWRKDESLAKIQIATKLVIRKAI